MDVQLSTHASETVKCRVATYLKQLKEKRISVKFTWSTGTDVYLSVSVDDYKVNNEKAEAYLKRKAHVAEGPSLATGKSGGFVEDEYNPDAWHGVSQSLGEGWGGFAPAFESASYHISTVKPIANDGPCYEQRRIQITAIPEGFNPGKASKMRF